jgi:hypothetical protein
VPGVVPVARGRLIVRLTALLLALPLAGGAARSETRVLLDHGRVSIHAESAPLTEVLVRFAQATGAEVVYETARPRQLVSVVIEASSAAEAIARLLEGLGLNYVLRLDPTGQNVEMLVLTGSAGPPAAPAGANRAQRSPAAPPPEETYEVPPGDVDQPFAPDAAEGQDPSVPPVTSPEDATNPALSVPWQGATPGAPPGLEPSSPQAPSGSAAPGPGQPQPPAPASYPGGGPGSPPVPPPPVYPGPASYPGNPGE